MVDKTFKKKCAMWIASLFGLQFGVIFSQYDNIVELLKPVVKEEIIKPEARKALPEYISDYDIDLVVDGNESSKLIVQKIGEHYARIAIGKAAKNITKYIDFVDYGEAVDIISGTADKESISKKAFAHYRNILTTGVLNGKL